MNIASESSPWLLYLTLKKELAYEFLITQRRHRFMLVFLNLPHRVFLIVESKANRKSKNAANKVDYINYSWIK